MTYEIDRTVQPPLFGEVVEELGGEAVLLSSAGYSSDVFTVDNGYGGTHVLKLSGFAGSQEKAMNLTHILLGEHQETVAHLTPEHVPAYTVTRTVRDQETGLIRILTIQPLEDGQPIREALTNPDTDKRKLASFLLLCLRQYWATRNAPDTSAIEGLFRVSRTPNIIIKPDSRAVLVDTHKGRTQRSPYLGKVWSGMIATGTLAAYTKLSLSRPKK